MIAYKFLTARSTGPFSGRVWTPGVSVVNDAGLSACRVADLPLWMQQTLWAVELSGEIVESETKVVATRARLLHRIEGWNDLTIEAFALDCAEGVRRRADREGAELPDLVAFAEDAAESASVRPVASSAAALTAYIAARAVQYAGGLDGYQAERARQSRWLADRLGLVS